jgi:hypothetical protein
MSALQDFPRITPFLWFDGNASNHEPPLVAVDESWVSRKLGLVLVVEAFCPNWKHSAKLQNLNRGDPDPALFVIPAGYAIQEW